MCFVASCTTIRRVIHSPQFAVHKPVERKLWASRICPLAIFRTGFFPRVAPHQSGCTSDEWNPTRDERLRKLTIYPLAPESGNGTIGSGTCGRGIPIPVVETKRGGRRGPSRQGRFASFGPSVGDKFSPVAGHKMLYGTLAPRVEQLRNKVSHQRWLRGRHGFQRYGQG